ncbi:4-hydroxy-tetrahydrodipicolinate synthase [Echinicola jeungdonensis]|uniref:4-hydroxy-tetrahydrodipicolinate synthase n=1 Tax=Echinicola jeungdonensis TaxID=709343 RepID=A0ABV5J305_9BACT|nr:4-hydroxy-tetrahydrodipicolinate synthase [Echinicola jeungdonensis]MDN3668013.1 4-hydroxy-tetrahydrodipicolinate synthase [Echinicola jeungdonensis]
MKKFKGTGVALVTPFHEDGSIDYSGFEKVIEHVIQGGADYLVVLGTTGETATMTKPEKQAVLASSIKVNKERVPIVYGVGSNNTQAAMEEIRDTDFTGVSGILSVSPYYNKPSQQGIISHFQNIADESPVPVILYNVPGRTMSNMTASTTLELAKHPNIVGIKEASGDIEQCMQIVHHKPEEFLLISGDDILTCALRAIGCEGVISVLANAYPEIFKDIIHGDKETSMKAAFRLLEINPHMYAESNPVGVKNLLKHMGICGDQVRLPLLKATPELNERIKDVLQRV